MIHGRDDTLERTRLASFPLEAGDRLLVQGGEETLAEIREAFGDAVADIVDSCTDTMETPKPPWRPPWDDSGHRSSGRPFRPFA